MRRSYREIAGITGKSKSQVMRDCKEAQEKIDNNDEEFLYHLTAILEELAMGQRFKPKNGETGE